MYSIGSIVSYLETLKIADNLIKHCEFANYFKKDKEESVTSLTMDAQAFIHLEIFENNIDNSKSGSLFNFLDRCSTNIGKRMLTRWICAPLHHLHSINLRLDAVQWIIHNPDFISFVLFFFFYSSVYSLFLFPISIPLSITPLYASPFPPPFFLALSTSFPNCFFLLPSFLVPFSFYYASLQAVSQFLPTIPFLPLPLSFPLIFFLHSPFLPLPTILFPHLPPSFPFPFLPLPLSFSLIFLLHSPFPSFLYSLSFPLIFLLHSPFPSFLYPLSFPLIFLLHSFSSSSELPFFFKSFHDNLGRKRMSCFNILFVLKNRKSERNIQ